MASRRLVLVLVLLFLPALMTIPGVVQPAAQMEVVARDVVDRDSLQAFVQRARAAVEDNVNLHDDAYAFADMEFRPMGEWNDGPIYIFFLTTEGVIHFHGASMSREGTDIYDEVDNNGVQFTKELVDAAAMGGGFVDYLFDNPDVMGDEEDGSPKVGYAEELIFDDGKLVIGSGFYPATPAPFAPPLAYLILTLLLSGAGYLRLRRR